MGQLRLQATLTLLITEFEKLLNRLVTTSPLLSHGSAKEHSAVRPAEGEKSAGFFLPPFYRPSSPLGNLFGQPGVGGGGGARAANTSISTVVNCKWPPC